MFIAEVSFDIVVIQRNTSPLRLLAGRVMRSDAAFEFIVRVDGTLPSGGTFSLWANPALRPDSGKNIC